MGDSKPNGSKTLVISERTDRLVRSVDDGFVSNENTSALGSYFKPSIFIFKLIFVIVQKGWRHYLSFFQLVRYNCYWWPIFGAQTWLMNTIL